MFASGMAAIAAALSLAPEAASSSRRPRLQRHRCILQDLAAAGRLHGRRVDISDTAAVTRGPARARTCSGWSPRPTRCWRSPTCRALIAAATSRARPWSCDNTFATPLRAAAAGAGRGRRRALGDQVPRRALRRPARRHRHGGHRRRPGRVRAAARHRPLARRDRRTDGDLAGPARLRTLHLRVERAQRQRGRPRRTPGRPPGGGSGSATPASARSSRSRCPGGAEGAERVARGDPAVDARHEPRRRRVADRTAAPPPVRAAQVPENLLRLSVGIEDVEDLWRDLDGALRPGGDGTAR